MGNTDLLQKPLTPVMVGYCTKPIVPFNQSSFASQYTRNVGNLLFVQGLESSVHTTSPLPRRPQKSRFKDLPVNVALLAPMSNHIASHVDLSLTHPYLPDSNRKVLLIGIGIQSSIGQDPNPPNGSLQWLASMGQAGAAIWTRGQQTTNYLTKIGVSDSSPIGCPSLFINPSPKLGQCLKEKVQLLLGNGVKRLAVAAGNPFTDDRLKLEVEQKLVAALDHYDGSYIVQNPMSLISLAVGWHNNLNDAVWRRIKAGLFHRQDDEYVKAWFKARAKVYVDVSQWLISLNSYDLTIGTRIHGVQAGLQAGIPSVCITHDSRTSELCHQMSIPSLSVQAFNQGNGIEAALTVLDSFDFDYFDANRKDLAAKAVDFFLRANLLPSQQLLCISGRG